MSADRERRPPPSAPLVPPAVRIRLATLAAGLIGAAAVAWSMHDTRASAEAAGRLGMARVQSNMEDILGILAIPVLLFFVILAAWSALDLLRLHRAANDPASYRRARRPRDP